MNPDSLPFIQKRFFEEWLAWTATEPISTAQTKALGTAALKQLSGGKRMEKREPVPQVKLMPMRDVAQEPMTEGQIRDRREMLRQQLGQTEREAES